MTDRIKTTSGEVLPWTIDNINKAPTNPGVCVLRSGSEQVSILYITSSDNLQRTLSELFLSKDIQEVSFFDWYEAGLADSRLIESDWIAKYKPKYN